MFWLGFLANAKQAGEEVDKATGCEHELLCVRGFCGIQWAHWVFQKAAGEKEERGEEAWKQRSSLLSSASLIVEAVGYSNPFQAGKS